MKLDIFVIRWEMRARTFVGCRFEHIATCFGIA